MNGTDILKSINAALKSKKLYPPGHPAIAAPINKAYQVLTETLKAENNLAIGFLHDTLAFEEELIADGDKLYPELIGYMKEKNLDAIIFERGVQMKEITSLVDLLASTGALQGQDLQREVSARGISRITLKSVPLGKRNVLEIYNDAVETVKNVMHEVRLGKIPRSEPVNKIIAEISDVVLSDPNAILGLTMIKNYDNYLYNHSVNVSIMSLSLGKAMDLGSEELHAVGVGALLHDIGKTGVAEDIIRKPGGLSTDEWEKVKQHPLLGSNIIKRMDGLSDAVGRIVYEHHIKYDHSGYPQTEANLHPLSQIITICDAYDALTTLRVYQQPHNPVEAIKVMTNFSGRHFNPDILKAFVNMLGVYPVGTMVRLSTNEIGLITKINYGPEGQPVVKVLYDTKGQALPSPFEIDFNSENEKSIVTAVNPAITNTDIGSFFEKEAEAAGTPS